MKFKRNLIAIFSSISILSSQALFSSCDTELEVVQTINEEFVGINQLEIESGFLDVIYFGDANANSVQVDAVLESNRSGKYRIHVREESGKLTIELDQKNVFGGGRDRGRIYINGPLKQEIELDAGSGSVQISNVIGEEFDAAIGSGTLDIQQVKASKINLNAGSGEIKALNLEGYLEVEVGSGNVTLNEVMGDLNVSGSSGRFKLNRIHGLVDAKLNSGNIDMWDVEFLGKLEVSSGNIEAINSGLSEFSRFKASSGNIKVQTNSDLNGFNYELDAGSGRVKVGENSSNGTLKINNGSPYTVSGTVSSGNIEIRN
ncbi:DUF4097 family beta strand repeat protein [Algoriphagus aestuarii]|nr:DUF4097 family beta strand repeat protein [Algoriphagus aestuarii]